jgi:hypothetical protein
MLACKVAFSPRLKNLDSKIDAWEETTMQARVSTTIIEEFEIRADCLEEEEPDAAANIRVAIALIKQGIRPEGQIRQDLIDELRVIEDWDSFWLDKSGRRQWLEAAAWLGDLQVWRNDVISTHRRKSAVIDGIKYEV